MNAPASLLIDAIVSDTERPALVAASEQLRECLGAASGSTWPVAVRFRDSLAAIDAHDRPTVVIASLLPELALNSEPLAATEARWREQLLSLAPMAIPAVLICTIFRRLANPGADPVATQLANPVPDRPPTRPPDSQGPTLERIRRLNMLAIELSHDTGAGIVDIDRMFAHLGARPLATDHRLAGRVAAEVAAYTIVSSIVGFGLDDVISPQIQERAQQFRGDLWDVGRFIERRLGQRR